MGRLKALPPVVRRARYEWGEGPDYGWGTRSGTQMRHRLGKGHSPGDDLGTCPACLAARAVWEAAH
jgi:hypothetical protein